MRQIVFRGKRKDNDEWAFGYVNATIDHFIAVIRTFDTSYEVHPHTVGQYTGLNDVRCNPIYEGDIICVTSLQPETLGKKMNVAVEYDGGRAAFLVKNGDKFQQLWLCALENDVVIIGNIYDNPELLKQE